MNNYDERDVLYLASRAVYLARRGRFANVEEYNLRVKDVEDTLNPDLDTEQHIKEFRVKVYNRTIADTADEALAIAISVCKDQSSSLDQEFLSYSLHQAIIYLSAICDFGDEFDAEVPDEKVTMLLIIKDRISASKTLHLFEHYKQTF